MPKVLDSFPDGVDPSIKQRVLDTLTEALDTLETSYLNRQRNLADNPLIMPRVVYDLRGHTAGMACNNRKDPTKSKIRLNPDMLNDPRYAEDMITTTVPHELAHIVQRQLWPMSKAHGWEWQQIMGILGLPPTVCHDYDTVAARTRKPTARPYTYVCDCGDGREHRMTALIHRRIQQQGKQYICNDCKATLVLR